MVKEKLDSKKIIKEIEESSEDIRKFGVKKIGLFGSFLHRDNKRKNDIDILVSFDNYMELKFLLEKIFGKKVDLVIEKNLRPELNYVKKEVSYARL